MTFHATVVQVLIASPGDTAQARTAILSEASRWNGRHANGRSFIISPWLYELHATPIIGDRPQAIINRQGVDKSDVVVAVFGSRLGTPTGVDLSGTTEEINRAVERGVPVHVYFSHGDLPRDVDTEQLEKLRAFRDDLMTRGLCGDYQDPQDLARQVIDALEYDLDALEAVPPPAAQSGARIQVSHDHQTREKGTDKRGKMQYRTIARDLVITNTGDATAEGLRFKLDAVDESDTVHLGADTDAEGWVSVGDLSDSSTRTFPCSPFQGRRCDVQVITEWTEDGNPHTKTLTTPIT